MTQILTIITLKNKNLKKLFYGNLFATIKAKQQHFALAIFIIFFFKAIFAIVKLIDPLKLTRL
jgi:hypothetical protein